MTTGRTVLDEVCEVITLPTFDPKVASISMDADEIDLDAQVHSELQDYVTNIAAMYRDNPFHNFEHASHVTMSVCKLLSRIVAPSEMDFKDSAKAAASILHDHTYGITSDPLTQFACVFSALIHDVDHTGVPNTQLVKEKAPIATFYKNKSVTEQNSVDLAWNLFMEDRFEHLRGTLCSNGAEVARFRQLVVNSVMATDIMDPELKQLRNDRWEKAFHKGCESDSHITLSTTNRLMAEEQAPHQCKAANRKATIVIEHLIQASDVAHTMQHWHVYRQWNENLFEEMYLAYRQGRAERDPSTFWYEGELGFFDLYIIPLAKKLKNCGVFGVSSDEYLNYAKKNRDEWENRGTEIVSSMIERMQRQKTFKI